MGVTQQRFKLSVQCRIETAAKVNSLAVDGSPVIKQAVDYLKGIFNNHTYRHWYRPSAQYFSCKATVAQPSDTSLSSITKHSYESKSKALTLLNRTDSA
ncbi:unnamed protein product [Soboliphyme baturini]|uniref:Transposase n=1 Tax=Soboliphyme baturini TaxID=241478 RepID=A0A183IRB9_9BILA|nr:unnamed protein product [Soboliphyme baturini]